MNKERKEVKRLLSYKRLQRYHRLSDGSLLDLEEGYVTLKIRKKHLKALGKFLKPVALKLITKALTKL
jgi:hypothetical protein